MECSSLSGFNRGFEVNSGAYYTSMLLIDFVAHQVVTPVKISAWRHATKIKLCTVMPYSISKIDLQRTVES